MEKEMWQHYNVHFKDSLGCRQKVCFTALDKEDAKKCFESTKLSPNRYNLHAQHTFVKVVGPLGTHPTTPKQKAAQYYRSCIGAAAMLERNLTSAINGMSIADYKDPLKIERIRNARALAIKQTAKVKRDVKDLFKLMGLNISG